MSDIQSFVRFVLTIPGSIWNNIIVNIGAYAIVPIVLILLPFARRLWNKIIKM